jgi:hypothetical protein
MNIQSYKNKFIVGRIASMSLFVWHTQINTIPKIEVKKSFRKRLSLKWLLLQTGNSANRVGQSPLGKQNQFGQSIFGLCI